MSTDSKDLDDVLWIFDLDGTLWEENSHVCIVEQYLGWRKYTNFLSRIWCRLNFKSFMAALNNDYRHISNDFLKNFSPHIVKKTSEMMAAAIQRKEKVIIISSAPFEIVEIAKEIFGIPAYHAEIGKKAVRYETIGLKSKKVNVVTDNVSDKDLIGISDLTYFRLKKEKNRKSLTQYQNKIIYFQ